MKIQLTEFVKRQFDKNFSGTKILDISPDQFIKQLNNSSSNWELLDGYADFCKLLVVPNFTDTKTGTLPINDRNSKFLKSEYIARNENELPVLTRYFEFPKTNVIITDIPKAEYLIIVLYDKEQLVKESNDEIYDEDLDYGIVAILAQMEDKEEPMNPSTMLRNALGTEEGGSGVPIDKDKYQISVNFWTKNATIK